LLLPPLRAAAALLAVLIFLQRALIMEGSKYEDEECDFLYPSLL